MRKTILFLLMPLLFPEAVNAGLDKYTYLDKIENWIIERKVDSKNKAIFCRASIFDNGTWFGSRIRLNKDGEIIYPMEVLNKTTPSNQTITTVKKALKACRAGFIYSPETFQE